MRLFRGFFKNDMRYINSRFTYLLTYTEARASSDFGPVRHAIQHASSDFSDLRKKDPDILFNYMLIWVNSVLSLRCRIPILVISCNFMQHYCSEASTWRRYWRKQRSFSCLRRLKTYLRSTMSQRRSGPDLRGCKQGSCPGASTKNIDNIFIY